ncbi:MAG: N-acetyltransferase family protein [Chloroflexota bacterium]
MTAISEAFTSPTSDPHIRPFDPRRDLAGVADVIEASFSDTLEPDGRDYLLRMRSAADSQAWSSWFATVEWAHPAMYGFVWVEDERIIGNVSLIPYYQKGRRFFLIANVAVQPDQRRRGIGRKLTSQAVEYARQHGSLSTWLHVRDDNPPAIQLYTGLGFLERTRRTSWYSFPDPAIDPPDRRGRLTALPGLPAAVPGEAFSLLDDAQGLPGGPLGLPNGCRFTRPAARSWSQQRAWLERSYPSQFAWHLSLRIPALQPGLWGALQRFLYAATVRQWAVTCSGPSDGPGAPPRLGGVAAWQPAMTAYANPIWLAAPLNADPDLIAALLQHVRRQVGSLRPLLLDYPAHQLDDAIRRGGFTPQQTLIWMELPFQ